MRATQIVEAVLFSSEAPVNPEEIARADESLDEDVVEKAIVELKQLYEESERAFEIKLLGGGYQIVTLPVYATYLDRFDTVPKSSRLSGPALETLAIIAYRQPIGRIDIEYVRGVSSAGVVRTLQERELVEVVGRGDGLGRPLLYGTTSKFLEHFGFSRIEDLPRTDDLPVILKGANITEVVENGDNSEGSHLEDSASKQENAETDSVISSQQID